MHTKRVKICDTDLLPSRIVNTQAMAKQTGSPKQTGQTVNKPPRPNMGGGTKLKCPEARERSSVYDPGWEGWSEPCREKGRQHGWCVRTQFLPREAIRDRFSSMTS